MSIADLPEHLQKRLRSEIKPGESLAWAGQPNPNRYMRKGFALWLFFIPWTAFTLFWIAGAANFKVPSLDEGWSLFPFFGTPFLLVGIGGLCSPFWLRRKAHSNIYAVSNRRAILIEGTNSITVKSYLYSDLKDIERTEHSDGSGDLILRTENYRDSDGDQQTRKHGFFAIDNVRKVEKLVEEFARMEQV